MPIMNFADLLIAASFFSSTSSSFVRPCEVSMIFRSSFGTVSTFLFGED